MRDGSTANQKGTDGAQDSAAAPVQVGGRQSRGFAAALVAAIVLHGAVLVLLERTSPRDRAGGSGFDAEASVIEVTLVSVGALETSKTVPLRAADIASSGANDGVSTEMTTEAHPSPTEGPVAPADPAEPQTSDSLGDTPSPRASEVADGVTNKLIVRDDVPETAMTPPDRVPVKRRTGGAMAVSVPAQGAAAASPGVVVAYARTVAETLGRNRPKLPSTVRGTVRVTFAVAVDGVAGDIRVDRSSGRPTLDEIALTAVQRTRFPPPPAGMSARQRTYVVPYHFR